MLIPINFRWMSAIFDAQYTQEASGSIPNSLSVLPDSKNIGIAVGIVFPSCSRGEISILPIWMPPSWISYFRLGHAMSLIVLLDSWTSKHRYSLWKCVAIMSTVWDMGTSSLEAAILDFPLPVRTCNVLDRSIGLLDLKNIDVAFEIVFLSCHVYRLRYGYFRFGGRHLGFSLPV